MQPLADIHVADLITVRCDCPAGSGLRPVRCLDLVFGGPHLSLFINNPRTQHGRRVGLGMCSCSQAQDISAPRAAGEALLVVLLKPCD